LFFRPLAETFGFELPNLSFGVTKLGFELGVALDCVGMPAFPVAYFTSKLAHLPPQLTVFTSESADFPLQLLDERR
jgi:hypothetical protein